MISPTIFKIGTNVKGKVPLIVHLKLRWAQFWYAAGQARRIRELENQVHLKNLLLAEIELEVQDYKWRVQNCARENHEIRIKLARYKHVNTKKIEEVLK